MSFVVDANLLLYAVNRDCEFHVKAKGFIEKCAMRDEVWCFPWPVAIAFLRISTHPGILPHPLTPAHAIAVLDEFLELPHVVLSGEDPSDFWKLFRKEISALDLRGNGISDAHIVSIMRASGISTIYSKDRDFLRFSGIKVIDPTI